MQQFVFTPVARVATVAIALGSFAFAQGGATAPTCVHNGPYVAECTGQLTAVPVTSAGSFDPDGAVSFFWFEECPWGFFDDPTNPAPNMVIDLLGGCVQTCVFALRVTQGGETTSCSSTVTVQDTTPPVITCPPDFTEIWAGGIPVGQTDPSLTGIATATDCDPAPVIGYVDLSTVPGTMAGEPEVVITREWTATDYCLNSSSCIQIITLLSPSSGLGGLLDVMPGSCSNVIPVSQTEGLLTMLVLGTSQFNVAEIDRDSLQLRRSDNVGVPIVRMISKLADKGRPGSAQTPNCSSPLQDGRVDLQISFSMAQIQEKLAIGPDAVDSNVEFALTGRMTDGRTVVLLNVAKIVQ